MRKLRYAFIAIIGWLLTCFFIAGSVRNIYISGNGGVGRLGILAAPLKYMAELPSTILKTFSPEEFKVKNSTARDGFSYFQKNENLSYPDLLVSYKTGKYENKIDLLDINTGALIKRWYPDNLMLYEKAYNPENNRKPPSEDSDLFLLHPLMTKDSSLLFVAPLTSMIAKIDKNSELVWMKKDKVYHHAIEMDNHGIIYSCTEPFVATEYDIFPGEYEFYKNNFHDDHITMLDVATGKELFNKSVIDILLENGYKDLLLYKGQTSSDPIHLNDIEPARYSTEYWNEGDLLISSRHLSTVFLYRPSTNKILWLKHGPWYNQHDPDFYGDSKIVIFGNDVIRAESKAFERLTGSPATFNNERTHNDIYVYDFKTDSITKPYHQLMASENVQTDVEGRCDILPNGDIYVEETTKGRIIIGDSTTKKVEFVKRMDEDYISYFFWARIIKE